MSAAIHISSCHLSGQVIIAFFTTSFFIPDWMIALAQSLHGGHGQYIVQPSIEAPNLAAL